MRDDDLVHDNALIGIGDIFDILFFENQHWKLQLHSSIRIEGFVSVARKIKKKKNKFPTATKISGFSFLY